MNNAFDVIVLGGGAAGLMCALTAGQRGKHVLVIEKSNKLGKKILMSGGGRCNFTNLEVLPEHYICPNPHFVKSALKQYTQWDFIALVEQYGVSYHEKKHGQLFCDNSAKDILAILVNECEQTRVQFAMDCEVTDVEFKDKYQLICNKGNYVSESLVIATGGLSIPTLGGSGFAYDYAKQRGLSVNSTQASLVPFTLTGQWHELTKLLSGVALPVIASVASKRFAENMLFTHRGLSGPAILQLSNYWYVGEKVVIDLAPKKNISEQLITTKLKKPNIKLANALVEYLPKSLIENFLNLYWSTIQAKPLHEIKNSDLKLLGTSINNWELKPSGTEGYRTAEVTRGGIDVDSVSSKTMRANLADENLYIIGEALDVTGHLGGFNFQWAWSSGYAAGINL